MAESSSIPEPSVFQAKYKEFVEDALGALPEYTPALQACLLLEDAEKLLRFQAEVKVGNTLGGDATEHEKNPGTILPGVVISDAVWTALSENSRKAIWEHVRILSICCFMESGFSGSSKPEWMEEAMKEMGKKLEKMDFSAIIKKFMAFFQPGDGSNATGDEKSAGMPDLKGMFENGFPKLPERFLKGQLAKLAQEIVKDITPDDLGITPEMLKQCEKDPSRAFQILVSTFSNHPDIIQKTIAKIGKRLQQKVQSGAIRPQEIAREAEEMMKEFAGNSSFVDMMGGLKNAFGMGDDMADMERKAGRDGNARLSVARERLRRKLEKKQQGKK
jgi:hypothetical protein